MISIQYRFILLAEGSVEQQTRHIRMPISISISIPSKDSNYPHLKGVRYLPSRYLDPNAVKQKEALERDVVGDGWGVIAIEPVIWGDVDI